MKEKNIVVWVVLGAVLLLILNLPENISDRAKSAVRESLAPLQSALAGFSRKISEGVHAVRGMGGLMTENRKMASELVLLKNRVRDLASLERDNIDLRRQLQFMQPHNRRIIPCEVIARDISGWWQSIRLSKGTASGISTNMAVITTDGLVGKTVGASENTCDVLLISDPRCRVSAQVARTGAFGIASGEGPAFSGQINCIMEFINRNQVVVPGDEIITSGLGGVFPRGLLIGDVEQVTTNSAGLYQSATIIPKADLGTLTYVFVVVGPDNPPVDDVKKEEAP